MAYNGGSKNIVLYIMVFIASVIGISLLPEFAYQCAQAQANTSVTGITDTVVGLLPMLYAVVCIAGMVGPIYALFR